MLKKMMICISFVSLYVANVYAAPAISSVSGTFTDGSNITISGSSFGTKTNATPQKWDNFENGVNGSDLSGWDLHGTIHAKYSNTNPRCASSTLNARQVLSGSEDKYFSFTSSSGMTKVFLSFWVRYDDGNITDATQIKVWRFCYDYTSSSSPGVANYTRPGMPSYYLNIRRPGLSDDESSDFSSHPYPDKAWSKIEVQAYIGSTNTADGSLEVWKTEAASAIRKIISRSSVNMRGTSSANIWNQFMFGEYLAGTTYTASPQYDDIYIDNTWARVVIGDSPVYTNCTVREMQIPSAWSTGSITAKINRGAFGLNSTAYLYVIDSNGNVSNPVSIVIGSSGDMVAPNVPSGLNVKVLAN